MTSSSLVRTHGSCELHFRLHTIFLNDKLNSTYGPHIRFIAAALQGTTIHVMNSWASHVTDATL